MMTEEITYEFERGVNVAPQKTYTIEQVVAIVKKCKEVWARDSQPLVEALEAINKMAWEDNEWDAVRKYEKCKELADQALERFKGMNTLAPSKTD